MIYLCFSCVPCLKQFLDNVTTKLFDKTAPALVKQYFLPGFPGCNEILPVYYLVSFSAGLAVTFFEIGGIAGSFLAGIITDKWMQKVNMSVGTFK